MFKFQTKNEDWFSQGYRSLLGGILVLGTALVLLGVLIFAFPELIAFLAAAMILTAGGLFLYWAYQIWKLRKHVETVEVDQPHEPLVCEIRGNGPNYAYRRITMIMR
ncbi:MAG: hypothetical protein ACE5ER_03085 [Nitrospinaceae bacterium]